MYLLGKLRRSAGEVSERVQNLGGFFFATSCRGVAPRFMEREIWEWVFDHWWKNLKKFGNFFDFLMIFSCFLMILGSPSAKSPPRGAWILHVLKNLNRHQNMCSARLGEALSPSSEGVERKTGYLGLRTRRVLVRELIFGTVRAR